MDWNAAIEKNREALKRVLAMLVGMADLACGGATLPRHLHRAVLRLLRPAEAAARRLIVIAARGMVVTLPPPRPRKPKPAAASAGLRRLGIAVVIPGGRAPAVTGRPAARPASFRVPALPLVDRLRLPRFRNPEPVEGSKGRTRYVPAHRAPRILSFGDTPPHRLPSPPGPDDPIDATRLNLRLQALGRALDDLPREARRFARWRVRGADAAGAQNGKSPDAAGTQNKELRDAAGAQNRNLGAGRFRRVWPLRPGRPPGGRRRPSHEVHDILNVVHGLAFWALERPDTS